ncbi:Amino acid permease [Candidatus Bilamarchaeum dharawalense]|uniref:Amino acid permease n=1 Tax=Candidatus Bilamarchaeum dharawalense TaxID=2885759 RepID=A0A5E4LU57_9ARCH|nr:Amino acid permease [Candidatus Bilamarchaeum dharawalense]
MNKCELKKELGLLGSFSMGFADVGADIFLALGLIAAYAHGVMPLAILAAAIVYVCSGLSYAELAAAMPVSGGSSAFGRRAFGNKASFLAGWGLMLDYTIDIALFAVASTGYLSFFIPGVREVFGFVSVFLIFILMLINLLGIKESSSVNSVLTAVAIVIILGLLVLGFGTTFQMEKFTSGLTPINTDPGIENFLYSITLAIVAFVGVESISQGAEETKNPGKILPQATFLSIFFVVLFALLLSIMVLGIVTPKTLADNMDNPLVPVTQALPFSQIITPIIAFAGFIICFVSANTGIIGASRVVYSMSSSGLVSRRISWIHPKYCTPWWTVIIFSTIAMVLAFFGDMIFLGELYAFGALTAYTVTNLSLIQLRFAEPNMERPFKIPFNLKINGRDIPLITIIGSIGCIAIFILVALLHEEGRNFAFVWFVAGFVYYYFYKKYRAKIDAKTYVPVQHRLPGHGKSVHVEYSSIRNLDVGDNKQSHK